MKSLLTALLLALTFCCHAQISKKSFLISGSISYSHQRSSDNYTTYDNGQYVDARSTYTSNNFSFAPKAAYFLGNRWCVGLSLPVSLSKGSSSTPQISYRNYTSTHRGLGVGPFVRYYIPLQTKLFVVTEASYSRGRSRTTSTGRQVDSNGGVVVFENVTKTTTQQLQAGAGLSYLLNKNVGLELLTTYRKPIDEDHEDYYDDYNNITVQLGLQIYLSK